MLNHVVHTVSNDDTEHYRLILDSYLSERRPHGKLILATFFKHEYAYGWLVDRIAQIVKSKPPKEGSPEKILVIHKGCWDPFDLIAVPRLVMMRILDLTTSTARISELTQEVKERFNVEFEFYHEEPGESIFQRKDLDTVRGAVYFNFDQGGVSADHMDAERKEARQIRELAQNYGFFALVYLNYSKEAEQLRDTIEYPEDFLDVVRGKGYQNNKYLVAEADVSLLMRSQPHEDKILIFPMVEKDRYHQRVNQA